MPRARQRPREKTGKLAEVVANRIEQDIIARGWPIGTVLGSESDLLEQYGVSRAVLREAVRIVEHHLVGVMRRGPGGGLVVTAPDLGAVARAVTLQLEFQDIQPRHLYETRTALELSCVRLACERLTPAGIVRLREDPIPPRGAGVHATDFHVLIAELTGNPAMSLFIRVLDILMRDHLAVPPSSTGIVTDLHRVHRQIADAIIARDVRLAERRMLKHLQTVQGWLAPEKSVRSRARARRA
jgi:DNA-binding FadR family transcriptional regulator